MLGFIGFEDREGHQPPIRLPRRSLVPPGELEDIFGGLSAWTTAELVVGLGTGDDAAVVRIAGDQAIVSTADFFPAVVDDASSRLGDGGDR
jgi:selenophosphate synthase